jgi:N-acetylmuramoyl-L-alanine amidase
LRHGCAALALALLLVACDGGVAPAAPTPIAAPSATPIAAASPTATSAGGEIPAPSPASTRPPPTFSPAQATTGVPPTRGPRVTATPAPTRRPATPTRPPVLSGWSPTLTPSPTPTAAATFSPALTLTTTPTLTPDAGASPATSPSPSPSPTRAVAWTPGPRAPRPLVALDPGHGGTETGGVSRDGLVEKDVNLEIALALAARLRADGVDTVLTRATDTQVNLPARDVNGDGAVDVDDDLQARVDAANAAGAWALVSIHNNAMPGSPATRGTTTYYCDSRPFSVESRRLAEALQTHLLAAIRGAGYDTPDRQARDDRELRKPGGHLYLLGPRNERIARPSLMPGALGETLFLSNAGEAALLRRPEIIAAIAGGYAAGIEAYLAAP